MLQRKIETRIRSYLTQKPDRMLLIEGARQVGKSYIIRTIGREMFPNFIELNMEEDRLRSRIFAEAKTTKEFYFALSTIAGDKMKDKDNTLIFIDEIQAYDHLLTLVKFLMQENKFTYIASGSLLGITLRQTQSLPIGSLSICRMYPLDFEEFLWANGVGETAISMLYEHFTQSESLSEAMHDKFLDLFKQYLIVGGLPQAVNSYVEHQNIHTVREIQREVHSLYEVDCLKYEERNHSKLKIRRIYEMLPSILENKKKRVVFREVETKNWKRAEDYDAEIEYIITSGIALDVNAVSTPVYPLIANSRQKLVKFYLNDVGLLTCIYYGNNPAAIMDNHKGINLGSVYETVIAQELKAHGYSLYYYDNKKNGEVDFLIDDIENVSNIPIEVKSGKDYTVHSALSRFLTNEDYNVKKAFVLSNERCIYEKNGITYIPIYHIMFFHFDKPVYPSKEPTKHTE